ncbi:hypothetical protein diail_2058 [Diaporthe ilicicola]|nr:hypothetical protein diail_2058 [Diaporthe ilicicola]
MALPELHPSSKIRIIGSGVFGLSTALWLARSGYTDVTVFDMQDTAAAGYDPDEIDSASADINKIIRFSYGTEIEYQRLASKAAVMWEEWNQQLPRAKDEDLPPDLRGWAGERKLWWNVGMLRMSATDEFGQFEMQTLENMEKEGIRDRQFKSDDEADLGRARERGWAHKLDPCDREARFGVHKAVLDSTAGYVLAYKSCAWARHLAEQAGVRFVLGAEEGKVVRIDEENVKPRVETADGKVHEADVLVVACGGWTPSLLPEASNLLETTAGSVATIRIPKKNTELWDCFSPQNFPVVTWGMKEGMGIYSFPRDENDYINHALPSLAPLGISSTKLCWYTDSIDNSFLISYLPGKLDSSRRNILVCSGGSGHGFKFLPILGQEVVKILEGRTDGNVYADMWAWRKPRDEGKRNGLEEGEGGPRVLTKQAMASEKDWALQ